jgi:hypothetical protein
MDTGPIAYIFFHLLISFFWGSKVLAFESMHYLSSLVEFTRSYYHLFLDVELQYEYNIYLCNRGEEDVIKTRRY